MITTPAELVGLLGREVVVRVLNISLSGLLFETSAQMDVGTGCELRAEVEGEPYLDDIRITRCTAVQGAGLAYRVGAQFIGTTHPGPKSLRQLAARFKASQAQGGPD